MGLDDEWSCEYFSTPLYRPLQPPPTPPTPPLRPPSKLLWPSPPILSHRRSPNGASWILNLSHTPPSALPFDLSPRPIDHDLLKFQGFLHAAAMIVPAKSIDFSWISRVKLKNMSGCLSRAKPFLVTSLGYASSRFATIGAACVHSCAGS